MFIFIPGSSFDLEIHIHCPMSVTNHHISSFGILSDLLPDHRSVAIRNVSRRF